MKRTTLRTMTLAAVALALGGCQTAPRFAWWKHDKPPEDSSVVARSATPEQPASQSKPEAVAVAGLTPATPPSSTNLAAATTPGSAPGTSIPGATGALAAVAGAASVSPTPSAPATAPGATAASPFPTEGGLADKLVSRPTVSSATAVPGATAGAMPAAVVAGNTGSVPAAGPYDPNAYKQSAMASAGSSEPVDDRYGLGSALAASSANAAVPNAPGPLTSDPADRYGHTPSAAQAAASGGSAPLMDPAAVAADRYSNPNLPSLSSRNPQAAPQATTAAPPAAKADGLAGATTPATSAQTVKLTSAPGQFRPGRTSTYNGSAPGAIEIASRPSPPTSTSPPPAATTPTDSRYSTPPAPAGTAYPAATRTF